MKWTNRYQLPDTILRAAQVQQRKYDRGHVHRSVTQLISPPRIDSLRKKHFQEMEKDISEEWWALFGSAVHTILEMGMTKDDMVEQRMFVNIDGWELSGACDLITFNRNKTLSLRDYKVTTAFVLMKDEDGAKPEWSQQLNMLAYMATLTHQLPVADIAVVCIVRDWQRSVAQSDPLYPIAPVVRVNLPLWDISEQKLFLEERVAAHRNAEMQMDLDQPLPECTDEERWCRENSWAVIKSGGKKAAKVYYDEGSAVADMQQRNAKKKPKDELYETVFRPGQSVRCSGNYCQVAKWCDQYARIKEEQGDAKEVEDGP
jgi:hypothetical protein